VPARRIRLQVVGQAPPAPRERKDAAQNREKILAAARALLAERPIHDICMDEVARRAGVGKGTVYRRFEDRAALVRALLHDDAIALQDAVLAGFGRPIDAPWLPHAARLLDALFDFVADHAAILSEVQTFEAKAGPARYAHPAYVWQHDTLAMYLGRAIMAHEIAPVDPNLTADLILSALEPDLIQHHLGRGVPRAKLKAEYGRHWRHGVLGLGKLD
jgi:AcrR family transcriptional regulator